MTKNKNMDEIRTRKDLENYALSVIVPFIENWNPIWDPNNPPKGKAHWTGHFSTFIEGFCRPMWGLPFVLKWRKKPVYVKYKNKRIRIEEWYRIGLVSGTNPKLNSYWGEFDKYGQVVTEIAPLAMALFFGKERFWDILDKNEQKQVSNWLYKLSRLTPITSYKNNHYWFPVLLNLALKRLGLKYHKEIIKDNLKKLDRFYMGNGWYYDGTKGRYDYYIPWSHHLYPMLWMILEDKNEPYYNQIRDKYIERTNKFLKYYPYFFDKHGGYVPFGRSLAYRFAAVGIFPLAVYNGCDIDPGLARKITLANINYFKNHGAEPNNPIPPGFVYPSPQVVERYITVSSSYWCAKGLSGLIMPEEHIFWKAPEKSIPIEKKDYSFKIDVQGVNIKIEGNKKNGVTLYNNSIYVLIGGFGSTNEFYGKFAYNSRAGFGTSTRDLVASDNMISLMTADKTLTSHRGIFDDLGEKEGVYYSKHIPFSNDKQSWIKSALLPLSNGYHLRAHKVKLSRKYYILEGGFSCEKNNEKILKGDNYISITSDSGTSFLFSYTPDKLNFVARRIHPDAHILYPLAIYPSYITTEEFKKGEYVFVTVFYFDSVTKIGKTGLQKIISNLPKVNFISDDRRKILVEFKNKEYNINL